MSGNKGLVVRNIPPQNKTKVRLVFGGGPLRGRGKRIHNGRRYFQELPPALASHFTLYVGGYKYPYQYADFVRIDGDGRVRVRIRASQ